MKVILKLILLSMAVLMPFFGFTQWQQIGVNLEGAVGDKTGSTVSLNFAGDVAAVGYPGNDVGGTDVGIVRVFENNDGTWTQVGADIVGEQDNDQFGYSVSISDDGDIVAIGALDNDLTVDNNGNGFRAGYVKIYENILGTWTQIGSRLDGVSVGDSFGSTVHISGNGLRVAIGAAFAEQVSSPSTFSGHVRIFENDGGTWTQVGATLEGDSNGNQFGKSVALNNEGTILVVGAPFFNSSQGFVRVFEESEGTWSQVGTDFTGTALADQAGWSVSCDYTGNKIAYGSRFEHVFNAQDAGSVRVFERDENSWNLIGDRIGNDAGSFQWAGSSLDLNVDGTIVVTGAPNSFSGNVRIFEFEDSEWVQVNEDITGDGSADVFGQAVSINGVGDIVIIGAPNNDDAGTDAGHVKIFKECSSESTVNIIECGEYTVPSGNETYVSSGTYVDTIPNALGCDSVITINLTIHPTYTVDESLVINSGVEYGFGTQTLTETGDYEEVFIATNGCDSTVNLSLTVVPFEEGEGTLADPWQITTISQLNGVRNHPDDYFELMNDLDLSEATSDAEGVYYNGGLGWEPIVGFEGSFDGGGFVIQGLFINRSTQDDVGLFGTAIGAIIQNVVLNEFDIKGKQRVGSLVGSASSNSYINSIGVKYSNEGNIEAVESTVGGIVGSMQSSDMNQCYVYANVRTSNDSGSGMGGLVGAQVGTGNLDLGIQDSYALVDLYGQDLVGGIAGSTNSSRIARCYFSGFLSSQASNSSEIFGGNLNSTVITDSYWNAETNCNLDGNTLEELQTQDTYENWDFSTIWGIDENRLPHLVWQGGTEDHNGYGISSAAAISELIDVVEDCQIDQPSPLPYIEVCGVQNEGVPDVTFPITVEGTTVVTWTFTDAFGRVQTRTQSFTINTDTDAPVPSETTLQDIIGDCSVSIDDAPTAEDTCEGTIIGVPDIAFPITTQGTTVVTWTFQDSKGNASTQEQNVTITDDEAPQPEEDELPEITDVCQLNALSPPTAMDNCSGQIEGLTDATFPITAQGTTVITWTFTDENGNSSTQQQNVTLADDVAPVVDLAILPTITTDCDGLVIQPNAPSATDNCKGAIIGTTNQVFPFTATVDTQILWEFDDGNGNTSIQFQDVVVIGSDAVTEMESLCEGADFTFPDGTVWTGEASQVSTLTNRYGCDSLVTTNITVLALPEVDLGDDEVFACLGEELTFSIDESSIEFDTYTISTLFGNSSTDGPLTFEFSNAFAAATTTGSVFVTIELTNADGCVGTDQVQIFDNTMTNWGIGIVQNNDPEIVVSNTILPETSDSFVWDFGDGNTNAVSVNPTHTYAENGDYIITLTVSNECGDESLTTNVSILGVPLGLDDADEISVYPNPSTDIFHFNNIKTYIVSVLDMSGKQLMKTSISPNGKIDATSLKNGQYILQMYDGQELISHKKIIKVN